MLRALRVIGKISREYAKLSSVFLAVAVLWVDVITGKETQFPLVYVLPVGLAAWRQQRILAYAMAITLPVLRIGYEVSWEIYPSLAIVSINALVEIAAMVLYAYLVGRTSAQTRDLQKRVSTKELEISRLRTFAKNTSATLQGRGLSPGLAEGVVLIHLPPENEWTSSHQAIAQDDVKAEITRLERALAATIRELDNTQKQFATDMAAAESALLDVQLVMLNDVGFWGKCKRRVREDLIKAEQAIAEEVREMATMLEELEQDSMRERSADIRDVGRRVLRSIRTSGEVPPNPLVSLPSNTILVGKDLLPSDVMQSDRANLVALVTECGGPASHVAILARSRNIPAVSDIKNASLLMATGDRLLVDGEAGSVTVAPNKVQVASFAARRGQYIAPESAAAQRQAQKTATKDGVHIELYANIGRTDEAHLVLEYQLEGVGLYRSEFLFLGVERPPDLETQFAAYSAVARILDPCPVVIRTMDLGGEKIPRFARPENGLALRTGRRGLAYALAERKMFRTQLQAILRAAQGGDLRIMFPMVIGVADLMEARHLLDEVMETEQLAKRPSIGAMIETPAAVLHIQEIVKRVDFVSIGTNDLAHFILATDRQSQESPGVLSFLHPGVLRATDQVVQAALKQGVGLTVCGEAAGNPEGVCLLVGMGVRVLRMDPFRAARVRQVLHQLTLEQMETAFRDALGVTTPEDVRQIAASALCGTEV